MHHIRTEAPEDIDATRTVNENAFPTRLEAELVDTLRQLAHPIVSLVAVTGGRVTGHILFTPVTLLSHPATLLMGLGPMAVMPTHQRRGVGSGLVWMGLEECRRLGAAAVVVLGHPDYYPRFGFAPASGFGLSSEYVVPDDVFMALELKTNALRELSGTIRYHPAFSAT